VTGEGTLESVEPTLSLSEKSGCAVGDPCACEV
jgi:hypothetical protein